MKKFLYLFFVLFLFFGCTNQKEYSKTFILCNNEQTLYDYTVGDGATMGFSMPLYTPSQPFDETTIESIRSVDGILDIQPYYPLRVFAIDYFADDFVHTPKSITFETNISQGELTVPIVKEDIPPIYNLLIKPYYNHEELLKRCQDSEERVIVHQFDSDSGIYISERMYNELNLDESINTLKMKLPISIPVLGTIMNDTFETVYNNEDISFDYERYVITEFDTVVVEIEVSGVMTHEGNGSCFCLDTDICMPVEKTNEIYEMANLEKYKEDGNNHYYVPNTYIVHCEKGIDIEQLGSKLQSIISRFYLDEHDFEGATIKNREVFE